MRPALLLVAACAIVIAVPLVLWRRAEPVIVRNEGPGIYSLDLGRVPPGVSLVDLGDHAAFLSRVDRTVRAFVPDPRHLPGEPLWWCPKEHVFAAPTHGEEFDRSGRKIGGPARGDLDQYTVRVEDSKVRIDTTRVVEGAPDRDGVLERAPAGGEPWDSGPGSFCDGAIRSDR
jgi:nitrite reductase/ring-hydroxylating ferredoxin subunit